MEFLPLLLTVAGLSVFEIITSIDNAVINAEVLSGMSKKAQRWFLTYGFFFAVFVVRGFLPLLIIFLANPSLGLGGALTATFSNDPHVAEAIERTSPLLLLVEVDNLFIREHYRNHGIGKQLLEAVVLWAQQKKS